MSAPIVSSTSPSSNSSAFRSIMDAKEEDDGNLPDAEEKPLSDTQQDNLKLAKDGNTAISRPMEHPRTPHTDYSPGSMTHSAPSSTGSTSSFARSMHYNGENADKNAYNDMNRSEWRDKLADRSARQHIARIILTLIVKSANRPASINYSPREIARRLEHNLYMTANSKEEYCNVHTLKARLQQALDQSRRRQMLQNSDSAKQAQRDVEMQSQAGMMMHPHAQEQMRDKQIATPTQENMYSRNAQFVSMAAENGGTYVSHSAASGGSILDELERESAEMANGISDEPIAMPESELHPSNSMQHGNEAIRRTPMESMGFSSSPYTMSSNASSVNRNLETANASATLCHGMNLTGAQIQQIQQLQQLQRMQQLRRMQQLQQHQNGTSEPMGMAVPPATSTSVPTANNISPSVSNVSFNQAAIASKREDLKRRLIQLKHARTCTANDCNFDYCDRVKALLAHVSRCAEASCATIGCRSTRQLLSHFRRCRNIQCEVCSAIRPPMNEQEQRLVLRRQQERLCMLRHVSTCTENACSLPYCGNMKTLWKHICQCYQRQCRTDHCISSRYVLSHFKQCSKSSCEVCGPVRQAIKIIDSFKQNPAMTMPQCVDSILALVQIMTVSVPTVEEAMQVSNDADVASSNPEEEITTPISSKEVQKAEKIDCSSKRKPIRLQTEKEKKIRRKEQARIAKARALAKARAAATHSHEADVAQSGLIVRGSQALLRSHRFEPQQDISFLDSMTEAQLDEHIRSLRFNFCGYLTVSELKNRLMPLLTKLMESERGWAFNSPVEPAQWNIPDYFDVIKCPIDLGTIKKRLENEHYNSLETFAADVRLVFENCIVYNSSTNEFNVEAKHLLSQFEKSLVILKAQLERPWLRRCEQRREEMCQLCGGDSFKFAPCMLFCSGPCRGRIRRHTHYYSDARGEHHWCSSCYKQMKDGPIDMTQLPQLSSTAPVVARGPHSHESNPNQVLTKACLIKRKNSEVAEEPWVECDACKLWYHQICALFNERNHAISGEQEPFVCPICVKEQRATGEKPSLDNGLRASRLPITRMAKVIEDRVNNAIQQAEKEENARMRTLGNESSIGCGDGVLSDEKNSESRLKVTVREVLSVNKLVQVKAKMGALLSERYGARESSQSISEPTFTQNAQKKRKRSEPQSAQEKSASLHLTYRSRCICVFQELDGVDILIFTLYVQEYSPNSLPSNAGRVYVSYLDSVNYFQPKKWRTLMHQQVMVGFLDDSKQRGFHTAHIWSCPPLKGDDYIFFCKPENQKIPKSARLRQWYQKLLQQAKKENIVVNISNLYAEYYLKKKGAHELPYFEGDYWPRLAEDLLKQLEDKSGSNRTEGSKPEEPTTSESATVKPSESSGSGSIPSPSRPPTFDSAPIENSGFGKSKPMKKSKKKRGRKRKQPYSPATPQQTEKKSPTLGTRSHTKKSKKHPQLELVSTKTKAIVNPDPLMQKLKIILEPQKDDFFVIDLYPKCHKCGNPIVNETHWEIQSIPPIPNVLELIEAVKKVRSGSSNTRNALPRHVHHHYCMQCYESNKIQLQNRVLAAENGALKAEQLSEELLPLRGKSFASQIAEVDLQEIKYRLLLKCVDPIKSTDADSPDNTKSECKSELVAEREMDDVIMPCEIFDTREAFLMYCQNNHCQFDQIRRAKHSSMMVLYHLFNQGTTGFTFTCSSCRTLLASGNRWNCSVCPLFNLCEDCNTKTKHEHSLHVFKVIPIPRFDANFNSSMRNDGKPMEQWHASDQHSEKEIEAQQKCKSSLRTSVDAAVKNEETAVPKEADSAERKLKRIHNVDPQLLVQLDHASSCTSPKCEFTNCQRMRAMLKHGSICEQRSTGSCVLCKRIIGLLSAHARQCQKDYDDCRVPRCADIRRHLLMQRQKRQEAQALSESTNERSMTNVTVKKEADVDM